MQQESARRSNRDRTDATRAALIAAARALFVDKGYAATGTPEIVGAAGVTRGALYHHFADKEALFRAVVEQEAEVVAAEIERAAPSEAADLASALSAGGRAYVKAMHEPGRTRLLLLDGPAVLGRAEMDEIDGRHGNRTLREGLAAAIRAGAIAPLPLDALTGLLGAMYDRATLAVAEGAPVEDQMQVLDAVVAGLSPRR